jgi:hypothetical protein
MNRKHTVYVRGVRGKENVHEVGTVGECASEDAVEEAESRTSFLTTGLNRIKIYYIKIRRPNQELVS